MSLEQSIDRLASAVERNEAGVAVREIIGQRDAAQRALQAMTNSRKAYEDMWRRELEARERLSRKNQALRGVITRMKRRKSA